MFYFKILPPGHQVNVIPKTFLRDHPEPATKMSAQKKKNKTAGPNFMALFTVSTETELMEAGNFVLTASVHVFLYGLAANFGFCACKLSVTRHSTLTRLAQKFWRLRVSGEL